MHRALELGQGPDVAGGHVEVGVLLEALGRDHVPQEVDDVLALGGDLHLHHRVVEQVAAVVGGGRAHVVGGPQREELHRRQPRVGVDEELADVGEVGDQPAVELPVAGVVDRLVEGVGADADRGPAEVVLADVDRVERRVPGLGPPHEDLGVGDRVVLEPEGGDEHRRVDRVLLQDVFGAVGLDHEEDVLVLARLLVGHLAEHRHQRRGVAVADVVLRPVGHIAVGGRREAHLARVDVGAVGLLGETEGEDRPVGEEFGGPLLDRLVLAHPDRPEPEHRHLPGVPVAEAVEGRDLTEVAVAPGVPVGALGAVARRGHEGGERPRVGEELTEVVVPDAAVVLVGDAVLPQRLEVGDGRLHQRPGLGVEPGGGVGVGVEDDAGVVGHDGSDDGGRALQTASAL